MVLCVLAAPRLAHALSTDRDQPMQIEADNMVLNDKIHENIYTGNVVVTQGSLRITGNKLIVHYTENNDLKDAVMLGTPAHFRQLPDGKKVYQKGEALRMEYYRDKDLLYLIDKAKVTEGDKLLSGHRIVYDTKKSVVTARRATAEEKKKGAAGAGSGRVKVIIPPKKKQGEK